MMMIRSLVVALFVCGALSASAQKPACCASKAGAQVSPKEQTTVLAEQLKLDADQVRAVEQILTKQGAARAEQTATAAGISAAPPVEKSAPAISEKQHEQIKKVLDREQAAKYDELVKEGKIGGAGCGKESAAAAKGGACCASHKGGDAQKATAPAQLAH